MLTRITRLVLVSVAMVAATLTVAGPAVAVPPVSTEPHPSVVVDTPAHCIFTGDILMTWVLNVDPGFTLDNIVAPGATVRAVMEQVTGQLIVLAVPSGSAPAPVTLTFKPNGSFTIPEQPFPASCPPKVSVDFVPKCGRLAAFTFHNDVDRQLRFRIFDDEPLPPGGVGSDSVHDVQPGQSLLVDNFQVGARGKLEVSVDVSIDSPSLVGVPLKTFTYTEPSECSASPSAQPPAAAPQLPTTGANVTGVLVVGGALVGFGGLFLVGAALLRRRRTTAE